MSQWKGFVEESKSYMNHPDCWTEDTAQLYLSDGVPDPYYPGWTTSDKRKAAFKFWYKFPRACVRFHWFVARDWLRKHYA